MQVKILESNDNIKLQKQVQEILNTIDADKIHQIQYQMSYIEIAVLHSCMITWSVV